jgi:uncharacterized protein YegP (UPF0339 family)/outer membrane protein OmpA-like peptidoglycan-associated protein
MTDKHFEEDNYLPSERYEKHSPEPDNFARFEEKGEYYFGYFRDGKVFLRSEGYSTETARQNGIESVRTNMWDDNNFSVAELPGGRWVLHLHAQNKKEIARSRAYASEKEARAQLPSAIKKSTHHEDDYLVHEAYEGHPPDPGHPDMAKFEKDGEYLFVVYHDEGKVLLRSERYPNEAARDKGFDSVVRNREADDRYTIEEKASRFFLVLKAKNGQEIARSVPFESEKQAAYWLPGAVSARAEKMAAATQKSGEDNYLAVDDYKGHERSSIHPDFTIFEKDGEYFFALLNDSGEVMLRSEGYSSEQNRNKGIESVLNNKDNRDRYDTQEKFGKYFVCLMSKNQREIARSGPKSEAGAAALIAALTGPDVAETLAEAKVAMNEPVAVDNPRSNIWPWVLLAILALLAFLWFRSCSGDETVPPDASEEPVAAAAVGPLDCQLRPILFAFDSDSLPPAAAAELEEMAQLLNDHPGYTGKIMAFTDSIGTFSYNLDLSRRRCEVAKQLLLDAGVEEGRISAVPQAELGPVAINTEDDRGRHFNRRLELMIYDANGDAACIREEMDIPEELRASR